jgi:DNA-binding SARP family transcriptional activator
LNVLIIGGVARLVLAFSTGVGTGFVRTVYGAGDLAPDPGFSAEEAMIIQGRLEAAETALRQRLADHPEQHEAGLRLGALLIQMGRPDEAERVYIELRRHQLAPPVAMTLANRLIDLYEKGGRTDRLKVELGRFSGEWKGTGAGESAARRLREIKDAERQQDDEAAED